MQLLKFLFSVCFVIFTSQLLFSQESWESKMGDPNISFFEIQQDFNTYWANKDKSIKGAGIKPYKRWEYFMETRVDENGFYDRLKDVKSYEKFLSNNSTVTRTGGVDNWQPLGPSGNPNGNNGVGRINVIKVNPDDANNIFVGTPNGGLWESTDGGATWATNTDNLTVLGVSDIVFDPTNSDHMYMATGDRDHNDVSTIGIMESSDGGSTWALTNFRPQFNGLPWFYLIHVILINPLDADVMIVSTTSGVFRTDDAWTTWTEVLPSDCLRDMKFHPTNPNIVYGTTSGAYCGGLNNMGATYHRSVDNGVTWTQITLPNTTIQRAAIGVTLDEPNTVYFSAAIDDMAMSNDFSGLYKSTNSGATVTEVTVVTPPSLGSQQWYDWTLTVNPTNANELYAGGVGFSKSTDGGVNWSPVGGIHVDHHYCAFEGNTLYVGSDGGIYKTTNGGTNWTFLNEGLSITQYYRISNAETNPNIMLAGSQDNGTHLLNNGTWSHEFGGDGMDNAIDPNDELNLFVSFQYGNFYRSTNGGVTFAAMISQTQTGVAGAWVTPIKIDETNTDILYTGYDRIWKSTDDGANWSDIGGMKLTAGTELLRYIDVAKSNNQVVYTTDYTELWRSDNGGTTWTGVAEPDNSIRWIEIDPTNHLHVWLAADLDVYESTDGGVSWTDISSNLPSVAMNTIVFDDGPQDHLYVGTDFGIYYLESGTTNWVLLSQTLPNAAILELDILESSKKIRAATFGRGVWEKLTVNGTKNYTCNEALPLVGDGVFSSQAPNQGNGATNGDATHAVWYSYTASKNGFINVRSCNGGQDTRLHIYSGTCGSLTNIGTNDDACTMGPGLLDYASELELIPVTADVPIYIEWDDRYSAACFDFEIEFLTAIVNYAESFEDVNPYTNLETDTHDWYLISGATLSPGTGPNSASDGSNYLYVEASAPFFPNFIAILQTNKFYTSGYTEPELVYDRHMWGAHIENLELQISENGGAWTQIDNTIGDQGNSWVTDIVDLTAYKDKIVEIRFIGTTGTNYQGDIAIDNIRFQEGGTPNPCGTTLLTVQTSDITMDNMLFDDAYDIEVEATVNYNNITFRAGNSVLLNPNFELPAGLILNLESVPCP